MGRKLMAPKWADMILETVEDHPGITLWRILELTDLTRGQYRRAYNWTLDTFGEPFWAKKYEKESHQWVYYPIDVLEAVEDDLGRRLTGQVTRARRDHNAIHAFSEAHPEMRFEEQELLAKHRLESLELAKRKFTDA